MMPNNIEKMEKLGSKREVEVISVHLFLTRITLIINVMVQFKINSI